MRCEGIAVAVAVACLAACPSVLSRSCGSTGEAAPKSGGGGVAIRQWLNQGRQGL